MQLKICILTFYSDVDHDRTRVDDYDANNFVDDFDESDLDDLVHVDANIPVDDFGIPVGTLAANCSLVCNFAVGEEQVEVMFGIHWNIWAQ